MEAMAAMVPRLQAEESLRQAWVTRIAGAAAGIVSATHQKTAQAALDQYNQMVAGLQAQINGTAGQEIDAHGRPILRSANDIRKWFAVEGNLHV